MTYPWRGSQQDVVARQMASQAVQRAEATVAAMSAVTPSVGSATVPALSLGATVQVAVTISPAIPGAAYVPLPVLYGTATLLGGLTVAGVTAKTDTTVTVQVRAPLVAVAAGATLQVVAFRTS